MYAIKCRVHQGGRVTDNGRTHCIAGDEKKRFPLNTEEVSLHYDQWIRTEGMHG